MFLLGHCQCQSFSFKISQKSIFSSQSLCAKAKLFIFLEKELTHEKIKKTKIDSFSPLPWYYFMWQSLIIKKIRLPETCVTMDGNVYGVKGTKEDEDYEKSWEKFFSFSFSSSFHIFGWFFVCSVFAAVGAGNSKRMKIKKRVSFSDFPQQQQQKDFFCDGKIHKIS